MVLVGAAAAFVYGLLIYVIDPRLFQNDPPDARGFLRSLGIGFVLLLSAPVGLFLIGLSVVGIPVAVLGLFILISAVYTSFVVVAGMVGQTRYYQIWYDDPLDPYGAGTSDALEITFCP